MNTRKSENTEINDIIIKEVEDVVEKVESLPPEAQQIVMSRMELYQGDLPHPDILRGYNELYPEAAKRIIENGILETEHRRRQDKIYLNGMLAERTRGQILGFVIALVIVASGVYLMANEHILAGSLLTGGSLIGVVGLFTGNSNEKNESKKK